MKPLLQIEDLAVHVGRIQILSQVNLQVSAGESVGIVGGTGSGKTMTLRAIAGLLPSIGGRVSAGTVRLDGHDVTHLPLRRRLREQRGHLSMVPQASMSSLDPLQRIGSQIAEALRLAASGPVSSADVEQALRAVRLDPTPELLHCLPHELSGGMRQRVMIALALATSPRLLLADEPTTALDASVRASVLRLLGELRAERDLGMVIISHDINAIATSTDRVVVMHHGRVVEAGPTREVLANPTHPYTQSLLDALPERTEPGFYLPGPRAAGTDARVPPRAVAAEDATVLTTSGLDFSYGARQILHDVSLQVRAGQRVGIVGESGSGKSTLARLLTGILTSPQVSVDGRPWGRFGRRQPKRHEVQLILQDPFGSLTETKSALDTVAEACRVVRGLPRREAAARAIDLLDAVGLSGEVVHRRPRYLSGGQCQRVSVARALAAEPSILVADEPTSALDLSVQAEIVNLLLQLTTQRPLGLVVVSHDLAVVRHLSDVVVVLRAGCIVETGPTDQVLHHPQHPYTRQLVATNPWLAAQSDAAGDAALDLGTDLDTALHADAG